MVNLQTADKALKSVYLGVVTEQLNLGVNPLLTKIEQTSSDVWGKDIIKLVSYGLNGGVGAGDEAGELPTAGGNNYAQFRLELKNLFGSIEISDKAIRASQSNTGAFVNLLNAEMEGLLKASKFNLCRMLYGDGTGKLATIKSAGSDTKKISVNLIKNLAEGMILDIFSADGNKSVTAVRIVSLDRVNGFIGLDRAVTVASGDYITIQNSYKRELTGLGAIFSDADLYGLKRSENLWLNPYTKSVSEAVSSSVIQEAIDYVDEIAGSNINYICCAYDVKKQYVTNMTFNRINLDYMTLDGGYKAISYSGIPIVSDRFISNGEMYMLNTNDFRMHQLCDWRWLEGDNGNVIKQIAGKPTYSATLVKYADLVCYKPCGQARLTDLTA